jgi:two-component system, cell cycle response regulator
VTERILIADTSEDQRGALRAALEGEGFAVAEAEDAGFALTRLRSRPHGVALVDVEIPGGALELLDALTTDPDLATTSVVLMSDDLAGGSVMEGISRGAADCLRKPVDPAEAVVRTRAALRLSQLRHRMREGDERLTSLAATDDLTGLLARRFLESHLRGLVAAAARHGRPLSVVMLDVDHFKDINDLHGHGVGDFVLRTVVGRMQSRLREEDLLGRWGGDEMILVLPDVGLEGALVAAEGVRHAIAETEVKVDGERIPVTVSAGAATWSGESAQDLVERADMALYDAKDAGRNCVQATGVAPRA